MYRLTIRQILLIAVLSALFAGGTVAVVGHYWNRISPAQKAEGESPDRAGAPVRLDSDEQNNISVYERDSPGVVNITSKTIVQDFFFGAYAQEGSGSGSIIDNQGHILTNYHVIENASNLIVTLADKSTYQARIVGTDPDNDLAVIKINAPAAKLNVIRLGSSQNLKVGQKVLAIGNPFGLDRTLTTGVISGLNRPLKTDSGATIDNVIQTDASINPGNSGGPLLNTAGEMIGINTAIYSPSKGSVGIGFAVPVEVAKTIIPDLIAFGQVRRPWLGVSTYVITPSLANNYQLPVQEGLCITSVYRGSPAERAGFRPSNQLIQRGGRVYYPGDILVKVGEFDIKNQDDLYRALKDRKVGETVPVSLYRDGQPVRLTVTLTEKPRQYAQPRGEEEE